MTRFEQLKARKCAEILLSLDYQKALLDKWENISIEEMAKENIRQLDSGRYGFTFNIDPLERITSDNFDILLDMIKLWYSQEVDNNG